MNTATAAILAKFIQGIHPLATNEMDALLQPW